MLGPSLTVWKRGWSLKTRHNFHTKNCWWSYFVHFWLPIKNVFLGTRYYALFPVYTCDIWLLNIGNTCWQFYHNLSYVLTDVVVKATGMVLVQTELYSARDVKLNHYCCFALQLISWLIAVDAIRTLPFGVVSR